MHQDDDPAPLHARARRELRAGKRRSARRTLLSALLHFDAPERDYARVTELLSEVLEELGDQRGALSVAWYAGDAERQDTLLKRAPPVDRARTWTRRATSGGPEEFVLRAAAEMERAGLIVRAALLYEQAARHTEARALWSRLSELLDREPGDRYAAGLARFNVARQSKHLGDDRSTRDATVASVHRLEQAADRFESLGQRERAFDCFSALIAVGRLSGLFEHVLEGYVNAIRILTEDHLGRHALELYVQAIEEADGAKEFAAGAGLAREMIDVARRHDLGALAAGGLARQAALWRQAARAALEHRRPVSTAENALVAGAIAYADAGDFAHARELFAELSELDVEPARRGRYARASRRLERAGQSAQRAATANETGQSAQRAATANETGQSARRAATANKAGQSAGRRPQASPAMQASPGLTLSAVWHDDLVEWEGHGSAAEACADVLLDPSEPVDSVVRRAALVGRLVALAAEAAPREERAEALALLAEHLAPIELYSLIAPLETLAVNPAPSVRAAALRALGRYYYKRTFVAVERALRDPEPEVVEEATRTLERLRFDHAFEPLYRIYRVAQRVDARHAALRAMARIDHEEAASVALSTLEHGAPAERAVVLDALRHCPATSFQKLAKSALPSASPALRRTIQEMFRTRGWKA